MINIFKKVVFDNINKLAIIEGNKHVNYGELWDKISVYGDYLKRQGIGVVAIYGHKEIDMIVSILSCIYAKRAFVILDNSLPEDRIKKIISITNASLLIKVEDIKNIDIENVTLEELSKYHNNKYVNEDSSNAYIVFTSGSTGEPKGVPISYDNLINFISWIRDILGNYLDYVFNTANFNFDLSVADIFYSLWSGKTLIINNEDRLMNLDKANLLVATPTFVKMCLLDPNFNKENYSNLKTVFFCGERLNNIIVKKLYRRFSNIRIINAYGPSEATCAISAIDITKDMVNENNLPVGDINNLATLLEIKNNEIILYGKSVFKGYINGEIINKYHTGDLGFIYDNKLYLKGRIDNQIKYKGYRIELEEIENNISLIEGVLDVVVLPVYNDNKEILYLKAFIVGNSNKEIIIENLKKILPNYMIPKVFIFLDKLPINKNNKIDRKALYDKY